MTIKKLNPIHPGEVLREEFIRTMVMSQREFAENIGVTHKRLNQMVNEKWSISADTVLRLSKPWAYGRICMSLPVPL